MCGSLMGCGATDAVVVFEFFACFCVSGSEIRFLSGVSGRAFKDCGSNGTRRGSVVCAGGACGRRIDCPLPGAFLGIATEWKLSDDNGMESYCRIVCERGFSLLSSILLAFSGRGEGGWECDGPYYLKSTVLLQVLWI